MKDIIVLSGGLDSTVLLYHLLANDKKLKAISFNYGQKHLKEIIYAQKTCETLGVEWARIDLREAFVDVKSALLGDEEIPNGHYEDEVMKKTVVPFRNGVMLSIAVSLAESAGSKTVYTAVHAGDHAIYPDCRPGFINLFSGCAQLGTYNQIKVEAPFNEFSKRQIALVGKALDVPFQDTWSCYKGKVYHCGKCGTCIERKEALEDFDPTLYREG